MRRVALMGSVFFASLIFAPQVRAQAPGPTAVELTEKAKRHHDLGRLDDAIECYARAYLLSGESTLLFGMADAHREAGHNTDALRIFLTYLRRDPQGVHHEAAEKYVKELERFAKKGQTGVVGPAGLADKKPAVVAAPAPSSRPASPPPAVSVPAPVAPKPGAPQAAATSAPVASKPGAPQAAATSAPVASKPAPPSVVAAAPSPPRPAPAPAPAPASAPAFAVASASGVPPTASAPQPSVDLSAQATPPVAADNLPVPRWVPWTLAGTTVALGVAAIVSSVSASNRYDSLQGSCGQTTIGCTADEIDGVKSRARTANILWALTTAAAVGTGVTVYLNANAAGVSGLWRF